MSTRVTLLPGERTSLSRKVILPGMSMSNRCVFLCVARRFPSGSKSREVLWYFSVSGTYSGMLPPRRYVFVSAAREERAWYDGDCSFVGGEG